MTLTPGGMNMLETTYRAVQKLAALIKAKLLLRSGCRNAKREFVCSNRLGARLTELQQ